MNWLLRNFYALIRSTAAVLLCLGPLVVSAQSSQPIFEQALVNYEAGLVELSATGSPAERAAAIHGLALVDSPRYSVARDALAADTSPDVQVALLNAIGLMRDKSPQAVACVEMGLRSGNAMVLSNALLVFNRDLKVPLPFASVWRKKRITLLWSGRYGFPYDFLTGIGKAKPWRDPAWGRLGDLKKMSLLFRAGTRESVPLGIKVGLSQKPPHLWLIVKAEPVDVPYLIELLRDPHPGIEGYATKSLVAAKVPGTIESLQRLILEYWQGIKNISAIAIDKSGVGQVLPQLNKNSLYGLLINNPKEWFWPVYCELNRRKTPLKYADLRGQGKTGPLFNLSAVDVGLLRRCQLQALIREKVYKDLPDYFTLALMDPRPASALADLAGPLVYNKSFRETMPPAIAAACKAKLRNWLGRSPQEGGPPAANPNGSGSARKLLLYLSDRQDWDAAWLKVRSSKKPLGEKEALEMVLWGRDRRARELRQLFARYKGLPWFNESLGYPLLGALRNSRPGKTAPGPCGNHIVFPITLPTRPSIAGALRKTLIRSVAESGIPDVKGFATAFLTMRGFHPNEKDLLEMLHILAAPSKTVRTQARMLVAKNPIYRNISASSPNPGKEEAWIEANLARLSVSTGEPALSPPALTRQDSAWIDGILKEARTAYFNKLVSDLAHPSPKMKMAVDFAYGVVGGYTSHLAVSTPSDIFIRKAGPEFEPEIRACLVSPEARVRYAAALALWKMFRDPDALAVFKKDARTGNSRQRAEALNMLQVFCRRESSALFPPLLVNRAPVLRRVGLLGVNTFEMKTTLPEVLTLVTDQDAATAALAVVTLGDWHPPEARPLLLALAARDGPLAPAAASALTHYRSREDIDALLAAAGDSQTLEGARLRLIGVLSKITLRVGPQPIDRFVLPKKVQKLQPGALDDWKSWWAKHRREQPGKRAKSVIEDHIRFLLSNPGGPKVWWTARTLKQQFPGLTCLGYNGTPSLMCHNALLRWWNIHGRESPWDLFTSAESDPWENLDLLWQIDPKATKRLLFTTFYRFAEGNFTNPWQRSGYHGESFHGRLVRYAHVDFGDPTLARCGVREKMLNNWLAWARKEGWAE